MKCRLDSDDVCHNINGCEKLASNVCGYVGELNNCRQLDNKCMYPINCTRRQEGLSQQKEKQMDNPRYDVENFPDGKGRTRHGSPTFYKLLQESAETHDKKSHDYASNDNPAGNYHFAGTMSQLFKDPRDAGFIGRIGEKLYRLANIENKTFAPEGTMEAKIMNESIEDTETDIFTIMGLWISDRRNRRNKQ